MKPCPHCGGTGHVRSDSSTALHVIRGIEEHLLKDSRHHITVRTPAQTALYVLNHKRSNLVELEQRFHLSISIEADDDVGAQLYAVTRGAPAEPRPANAVEDTPAFEAMETDEELEAAPEERSEHRGHDHAEEDGEGHRKRRRRRRRRGGRDHGDERPRDTEQGSAVEAAQVETPDDAEEQDEDGAEHRSAEADEAGEHKKRRRGRRGGKRNRRDHGEQTEEAQDTANESEVVLEPLAEGAAGTADVVVSESPAPEIEVVAEAAAPEAEKPKKPTRRRSRKSEAAESAEAPVVNGEDIPVAADEPETEAATPKGVEPQDEQPAEPVVVSSTNEETRPRKTGWWQRKSFF
jgi:ribonuclease E